MGKYTIFLMFQNPRRSRQARNFTENDPKILDIKLSSEQIIFRTLSLGAPDVNKVSRGISLLSNFTCRYFFDSLFVNVHRHNRS